MKSGPSVVSNMSDSGAMAIFRPSWGSYTCATASVTARPAEEASRVPQGRPGMRNACVTTTAHNKAPESEHAENQRSLTSLRRAFETLRKDSLIGE